MPRHATGGFPAEASSIGCRAIWCYPIEFIPYQTITYESIRQVVQSQNVRAVPYRPWYCFHNSCGKLDQEQHPSVSMTAFPKDNN